jgi:hypothetical protein
VISAAQEVPNKVDYGMNFATKLYAIIQKTHLMNFHNKLMIMMETTKSKNSDENNDADGGNLLSKKTLS